MGRQHGITCETTQNLIIDSGAIYVNYGELSQRLLGATRGGNTFSVEQEIRQMEFDGMRGVMVGSHRLLGSMPKITANIIQWNWQVFLDVLVGSTMEQVSTTHKRITRSIKRLTASDYFKNIAIVGECTASENNLIACVINNVIQLENVEFPFNDKDETVASVTFTGCTDCSNMEKEPWYIDYPEAD